MDTQTIITEKMIFGGSCTAKIDGKIVFIDGLLPQERAEIRIIEEKRDYCRAEVVRILEKSPKRIAAVCPHYGECGGCNLQHTDGEYQRNLRSLMLTECFTRAGFSQSDLPEIEMVYGKEWEYRNRFQLHSGGLAAKKSNRIIPLHDCPIAVREIRDYIAAGNFQSGRTQVFGNNGSVFVQDELCEVSIGGKKIAFTVNGFFQSNIEMLEKIIPLVCGGLQGKRVADFYCGAGTFSVFLADSFEETVLVEQSKNALACAEKNLAQSKNNFVMYAGTGEKWVTLPQSQKKFDAVILDPPRSGIEKGVRHWLLHNKPPIVRYLSCDPATLARDAAFLRSGYKLTKIIMADFYPQTGHIEALAYFELQ